MLGFVMEGRLLTDNFGSRPAIVFESEHISQWRIAAPRTSSSASLSLALSAPWLDCEMLDGSGRSCRSAGSAGGGMPIETFSGVACEG